MGGMICVGNRHSRMVVEEWMKWALSRKVFGKPLIQQAVIRYKMAEMIAAVETCHSLLEDLTFQMCNMTTAQINKDLAGPIALLKYKQTRVATVVSDNACQIFGGSEEIMADFAIRQAMRKVQDMPARL